MADLRLHLLGLQFPHPVLAAAGPNVGDAGAIAAAAAGGAGGLNTRTICLQPRPQPANARAPLGRDGLFNCEQGSTIPFDRWRSLELPAALAAAHSHGIPLFVSLGYHPDEVGFMARALVPLGVAAIELSTHYTPRAEILPAVRAAKAAGLPVALKLSMLHGEDLADLAADAEPWCDAFVTMNSFGPTLLVDAEGGGPVVAGAGGYGFTSGPAIRPVAQRFTFEVARRVSRPVIACGGCRSAAEAVEMLLVGASAVQVCTHAILKGPGVYGQLAADLARWMDTHGYRHLAELSGLYLRKYGHGQRVVADKEEAPRLTAAACIGCTQCEVVCFYDAITAPPKSLPTIRWDPCFQCGLCVSVCPTGALWFAPRDTTTLRPADGC